MRFLGQQIAVRRGRVHAGQHRPVALEDLVMQAHAHARQVDAFVDDAGPHSRGLEQVVNAPDADRPPHHVTQKFHDTALRGAANQHEREDHLLKAAWRHRALEQHLLIIVGGGRENSGQRRTRARRLLVDEVAAHTVFVGQCRD